jgi:hypothetical protein
VNYAHAKTRVEQYQVVSTSGVLSVYYLTFYLNEISKIYLHVVSFFILFCVEKIEALP